MSGQKIKLNDYDRWAPAEGFVCPACGGQLNSETFKEACVVTSSCGYSYASHFGGGEPQIKPCRDRPMPQRVVL